MRHGRVYHRKLLIDAQQADTVLTQGVKRGWGQLRGIDVDFSSLRAGEARCRPHLPGRGHAALTHHVGGGAYGRGNPPLGLRDSRLEGIELGGEILAGGGCGQKTPQQKTKQQTTALPRAVPTECSHALLLSRNQHTLTSP